MLAEHGNISVGIDLGRDYSQIAFCSKSDRAPLMVMQSEEEKRRKRLPDQDTGRSVLFGRTERCQRRGSTVSVFERMFCIVKRCRVCGTYDGYGDDARDERDLGRCDPYGTFKSWHTVLSHFLQGHLESFYAYLMNQKKSF